MGLYHVHATVPHSATVKTQNIKRSLAANLRTRAMAIAMMRTTTQTAPTMAVIAVVLM